jgi:hypothetical protein
VAKPPVCLIQIDYRLYYQRSYNPGLGELTVLLVVNLNLFHSHILPSRVMFRMSNLVSSSFVVITSTSMICLSSYYSTIPILLTNWSARAVTSNLLCHDGYCLCGVAIQCSTFLSLFYRCFIILFSNWSARAVTSNLLFLLFRCLSLFYGECYILPP